MLPGLRRPVEVRQGAAEVERLEPNTREEGGDEGHGRRALDLLPAAYHAAARAPEEGFGLQVAAH
jgi:hypothetical protein